MPNLTSILRELFLQIHFGLLQLRRLIGRQIMRAFEAGWGGAVWKTLGQPIQNVSFGWWDSLARRTSCRFQ